MRYLFGFMCVLALGVMGCSETAATGGSGGTAGSGLYAWCLQYPSPWPAELRGVSFTDANTGTVVGISGTILRTTNGGVTWVTQQSGTTNDLVGVSFSDANTGTVVGGNGTILWTTDGGATWAPQISGTTAWLSGVSLTDANTGTAVGGAVPDLGLILRTTDSGATWEVQTGGETRALHGVQFTDASTGTAVGNDTILRTRDGGATWFAEASSDPGSLYGVSLTDANTGTAVGASFRSSQGHILRTTDVTGYAGVCDPFCAKVEECFLTDLFPSCAAECSCTVNEGAQVSAQCESAVANINECVADLSSCEQIEAWYWSTPADSYPCKAADDQRDAVCYWPPLSGLGPL